MAKVKKTLRKKKLRIISSKRKEKKVRKEKIMKETTVLIKPGH